VARLMPEAQSQLPLAPEAKNKGRKARRDFEVEEGDWRIKAYKSG